MSFTETAKGNPYTSTLLPRESTSLFNQWGRTGFRRGLANYPWFVDAKSGNLVVSERDSHRLQIFDCVGNETQFEPFGNYGHGKNQFFSPGGVTTTSYSAANVIVADTGNRRVTFFTIESDSAGRGSLNQTHTFGHRIFSRPTGIELDVSRGNLVVTDPGIGRVTMHEMIHGQCVGEFRTHPASPLLYPADVALDEHGRAFVTDADGHCVQVFDTNGDFLFRFGHYGSDDGQLNKPWGLCFDRESNLLVADEQNDRIVMFTPEGQFVKVIASGIYTPKGVSVNIHENLVVTTGDPYNFLKIIKYK